MNRDDGTPPTVRKSPCESCPYRRDVPSGIWDESEYDKLPRFDGDTTEQFEAGALGLFYCHKLVDQLCAGWVGCHDTTTLAAMRLWPVDPAVHDYVSPVPLFASGAEAAEHGKRDIEAPSMAAVESVRKVQRLHKAKGIEVPE